MFHNLTQNSQDWLTWRATGIGASDANAIAGYWNDYERLWTGKVGQRRGEPQKKFAGKALEWGHLYEPAARDLYTDLTGIRATPVCCTHDDLTWVKASLDGWNDDLKLVVEIKCPYTNHRHQATVDSQAIPAYYYPQVQHQLFASGGRLTHFVSYDPRRNDHHNMVIIEVARDEEYIELLIEQEYRFWMSVLTETEISVDVTAHTRLHALYEQNHLRRK